MNFVPKNPVEAVLAEVLAAIERPAWVIDVDRGLLVAANGRGDSVWGVPVMTPALNDAAVQALRALRRRAGGHSSQPPLRSAANETSEEAIQFWTCTGARTMRCSVRRLDDRAGPAMLLVIAEGGIEAPEPSIAKDGRIDAAGFVERWLAIGRSGESGSRVSRPAHGYVDAPPSDADTLREIARRIKEGSAGLSRQSFEDDADSSPENLPRTSEPASRDMAAIDISTHLAHEVRTPLAAIISLAEVITEERLGAWPNERYRAYIQDILDSARHGLEVVDAILKNAPGQLRAERIAQAADVDLNVEVEGLCASLQPLAEKSGARLEAAMVSGLPRVAADRRNVRQMLLNLISNAIKHGGAGVRIKVTTGYELGGEVWVEVEDDGPGMMAASSGSGASPRSENSSIRIPKAGLGLRLTRSLATANGAHLELSSKSGRGLRARIVFGGAGPIQG